MNLSVGAEICFLNFCKSLADFCTNNVITAVVAASLQCLGKSTEFMENSEKNVAV